MFYVYVLLCRNKQNTLYYGFTSNLRRRLEEHKKKGDIELAYYEAYKCESDARRRELFFKSGWGRSYVKKVLKSYLENIKYKVQKFGREESPDTPAQVFGLNRKAIQEYFKLTLNYGSVQKSGREKSNG